MKPSSTQYYNGRRGVYTILTTFLFVIIMVAVALGLTSYYEMTLILRDATEQHVNKFDIADQARLKIKSCYGQVLNPADFGTACSLEGINQVSVSIMDALNCTPQTWEILSGADYNQTQVVRYVNPVRTEGGVCLASVEVGL